MRARRIVGAIVLAICLGAPIVEVFDRWDDTLRDGNDTEGNAVVAALCVGLAFSLVGVIVARIRQASASRNAEARREANPPEIDRIAAAPPIPTGSPPLALRI